jgi:hypothetical protein
VTATAWRSSPRASRGATSSERSAAKKSALALLSLSMNESSALTFMGLIGTTAASARKIA